MSVDAFFAGREVQAERYERVAGMPVRMMAGACNVHDDGVVNILALLRTPLRGSGCRPFTDDGSAATLPGRIRRPAIGREETVALSALDIALPLAGIYDRATFPTRPRLVADEPGGSAA